MTVYTPSRFVVPIGAFKDSGLGGVSGTGVFVARPSYCLTVAHIVKDNGPWKIGVPPSENVAGEGGNLPAHLVAISDELDLALLEVPDYVPPHVVELAEEREMQPNVQVVCFDYSATAMTGKGEVLFNPSTWVGNVVRWIDASDLHGMAGVEALELSFPVGGGASGAPVLSNPDFRLWGLILGNIASQFQVRGPVLIKDEVAELPRETEVILPQAIAVSVRHIRAFLADALP